jgi:hypothetical protein
VLAPTGRADRALTAAITTRKVSAVRRVFLEHTAEDAEDQPPTIVGGCVHWRAMLSLRALSHGE